MAKDPEIVRYIKNMARKNEAKITDGDQIGEQIYAGNTPIFPRGKSLVVIPYAGSLHKKIVIGYK